MLRLFVQRDGEDGQVLDVSPRQVLQWEKAFPNRSMTRLDNEAVRLEYLYELAWVVLDKPGELAAFQDSTDVAFVVEEKKGGTAGEADPTQSEVPTGSSSTSRSRRASRSPSGDGSSSKTRE
jgi:hypothetical protein